MADQRTSKLVTYNDKVKSRSVTFDGELFEPSGTITGGSSGRSTDILLMMQSLRSVRLELKNSQHDMNQAVKEMEGYKEVAKAFKKIKQEIGIQEHKINLLEERVSQSAHSKVALNSITVR